ncbi:hypothetical protein LF887_08525 [Chryseobacterium sp. MEBOG06]|uniref:hypothetical protein n=1 Tax=Chryseobacterium sp. MEBOG06 TaxID=2879938 RepID=UPI001F2CB894|nr:hypothetical protein [Chryseobacterium sp. MEBOG06]UKB85651.1 hypothetical protein LF887_08525 [Chryseobacterium sp. MEBOG06]
MAKNPRKDLFPDTASMLLKNVYGAFPKPIMNIASTGMRLMMKIKKASSDDRNVLYQSSEPHRIYGETMFPAPSKKTKMAVLAGVSLGLAYMLFTNRSSNKDLL